MHIKKRPPEKLEGRFLMDLPNLREAVNIGKRRIKLQIAALLFLRSLYQIYQITVKCPTIRRPSPLEDRPAQESLQTDRR